MNLFRERFENSLATYLNTYFENIVFVVFALLLIGVPLAVDVGAYLTFEPIKVHVLSLGAGLLAAIGLVGWALGKRWRKPIQEDSQSNTIWKTAFFGYWTFTFLAIVTSIAPMVSLWGLDPRYHGLLYSGALLIMMLAVGFLKREHMVRLLEVIMVTAVVVSVYGILQRLFPALTQWWDVDSFLYRSFSTLGHPNYLADYLVLATPLFFWKFFESRRWWIWLVGGAFVLLALLLTLSRSGFIGLFVSFFFVAIVYSRMSSRSNDRVNWRKIGGGVLVVLSLVTALVVYANVRERDGFTYSKDLLSRLVIGGENLRSLETRLLLWPATFRMIVERPILGYGPDTYPLAFTRFAPQELLRAENMNSYADRAHNIILDTMQEIGVIGGVFFLMILFWSLRRAARSQSLVVIALGASLAGHFASQQFGFQTAPHALHMWFFIAAISFLEGPEEETMGEGKGSSMKSSTKIAVFILAFIILVGTFYAVSRLWKADRLARDEQYIAALNVAPIRLQYGLNHVRQFPDFPLLDRLEAFTNHHNYRVYWYRARGYLEQNQYTQAYQQFDTALTLAPTAIRTIYEYGEALFDGKKYQRAVDIWKRYIQLSPDYWRQHEAYRAGLLTPWERNRYEVFYKLYPNFDEVFEQLKAAEQAAEQELQTQR